MSPTRIVSEWDHLEVTPDGHAAALTEQSCDCRWCVESGMLICMRCGTGVQLTRPQAARPTLKGA